MALQDIVNAKKVGLLVAFVGVVLLIGHELKLHLSDLETWIVNLGAYAPVGFIALFVLSAPFFVSIDALCFAAGMLFPLMTGEMMVIIATYLSAAVIFFLGRDFMRERVEKIIAGHERFAKLDHLLSGENAFKLMFLLRLTPLPFAMLSYALAVTEVKLLPYLVATTGILLYNGVMVYLGFTTKHLTGLVTGAPQSGVISHSVLIGGLLGLIIIIIGIMRVASQTLRQMNVKDF